MALLEETDEFGRPLTLGAILGTQSAPSVLGEAVTAREPTPAFTAPVERAGPSAAPSELSPAGNLADGLIRLRDEQAASLQQHAQFSQGLQQQQQQVDLRSGDLDVAERMLRVLDTNIPKIARMAMFRELEGRLRHDPNSPRGKELGRTLIGLDPDTAAGLRRTFADQMNTAQPGQITEFTNAILKGDLGVHELTTMVGLSERQRSFREQHGPPMGLGGPTTEVAQVEPPPAAVAPPADPASASTATVRPGEIIPELATRLGFGPEPRTNTEAMAQGYRGPTDAAAQRKMLLERETAETKRLSLLDKFIQIDALGFGRPEVSPNTPWTFPFGIGTATRPTGAQIARAADNTLGPVAGAIVAETIPGAPSVLLDAVRPSDPLRIDAEKLTGRQRFIIARGARQLIDELAPPADAPPAERQRWYREQAGITDEIQALYGGMRFELGAVLAQARPAGLSEAEGNDILTSVTTSDPASRRTLLTRITREIGNDTDFAGGPAYNLRTVAPERLTSYVNSPLTEGTTLRTLAQAEIDRRAAPASATPGQRTELTPTPGITVAPPASAGTTEATAPPAGVTAATAAPQTEAQRARAEDDRRTRAAQDAVDVQQRRDRAALDFIPEQRERFRLEGEQRLAAIRREEENHARAGRTEQRAIAREQREAEEKRQAKIQAAFAAAGRLIAGAISGGGSGGGSAGPSGGDDPNAFRLSPTAPRRAPTPPQAISGQTMPRQRGGASSSDDDDEALARLRARNRRRR